MALQWREPQNTIKPAKTLGEMLITLALNYASPFLFMTFGSIYSMAFVVIDSEIEGLIMLPATVVVGIFLYKVNQSNGKHWKAFLEWAKTQQQQAKCN